ncbi:MAG TPA: nucleoside hydrolase [Bryobacterales bacterium]|jgi:purine nucleosidase|nr:nucleoside hydrolase [Bryobacterales bacterium]
MSRLRTVFAAFALPFFLALPAALAQPGNVPSRRDDSARPAPRPVLMVTDCGVDMDDQWALAHLALSPEFNLVGVVTTHAPTLAAPAAQTSARVARDVLDHLPLRFRPLVIPGSSVPLAGRKPQPNPGVDFLLRRSRSHSPDRRLDLLLTGAATDVASALLIDPGLGDRIRVIAMGFNNWPRGTDPFNVKNDVTAWQVLLESRAPVVIGDTAVTNRYLRMTREKARELFYPRGAPGVYLANILISWLDDNGDLVRSITGNRNAWPVWDEVTVAYLLGLTKSRVHPRPVLRDDMTFEHPASGRRAGQAAREVVWITAIDAQRLWADFTYKLDRALALHH